LKGHSSEHFYLEQDH